MLYLYKFDDLRYVGFELWQVKSGTIFDNVLVTDDPAYAEKFANETWGAMKDAERKMFDAVEKARADERSRGGEEGDRRRPRGGQTRPTDNRRQTTTTTTTTTRTTSTARSPRTTSCEPPALRDRPNSSNLKLGEKIVVVVNLVNRMTTASYPHAGPD